MQPGRMRPGLGVAEVNTRPAQPEFDLKRAIAPNRLSGMLRIMSGYRSTYVWATITLALAASLKTGTYLLLRYFVDEVLGKGNSVILPLIGLGFVLLAGLEGTLTFLSGRLAAYTAEGVARRLRNYLF